MDIKAAMLDAEEQRRQQRWHRLGLVAAPLLAAAALLLAPDNMSPRAARLMAVLAATFPLWLTEALPVGVTALAAASAAVVLGIADTQTIFAPFSHPTIWLLLAAFLFGAIAQWRQLDRVFILGFFTARRTRLHDLGTAIAVAAFALSTWLPNRASVALLSYVVTAQDERFGKSFQRLGLSSVAFASALGGLVLPIGAPANLIAIAALSQYDGREFPLLYWTLVAAPLAALLLAAWLVVVRVILGADGAQLVHGDLRVTELPLGGHRRVRPPTTKMLRTADLPAFALGLDRSQFALAVVLCATLLLWSVPGVMRLLGLQSAGLEAALAPAPVALLLVAVLFALPAARRKDSEAKADPVASWQVAERIDWDVILLVGSALALGHQTIDTGLSHWLGDLATRGLRVQSVTGLTWLLTGLALVMTQITSAAVTAAICAPLAVVMAQQTGASPVAPCLAVGMAASFGLMLPMSDECNLIVWKTGRFHRMQLFKRGLVGLTAAILTIPPLTLLAARILGV
ncbi:MAG: anion permease [Deltaproteobacteria bacterium]|nr:anion permease [Deltaproteobacteria bacterium]